VVHGRLHCCTVPGAVMFMYACMILSIFLASGQGTTGWALKFKSYNTSSMNESLGPVRFSYNSYFSTCFLVGTMFFSHNKSAGTVFASLVIHTFQLVFSAGTMFFSHNESAGIMFRFVFSAKRTGPMSLVYLCQ